MARVVMEGTAFGVVDSCYSPFFSLLRSITEVMAGRHWQAYQGKVAHATECVEAGGQS